MQRTAYNFSIPDSLTLREQGITRLTCLRLYREFADECRWLARVAQTPQERKVLQDMEAALTKLAEAVDTETSNSSTIAHPLNLSSEESLL
jgi:hypothetical protein